MEHQWEVCNRQVGTRPALTAHLSDSWASQLVLGVQTVVLGWRPHLGLHARPSVLGLPWGLEGCWPLLGHPCPRQDLGIPGPHGGPHLQPGEQMTSVSGPGRVRSHERKGETRKQEQPATAWRPQPPSSLDAPEPETQKGPWGSKPSPSLHRGDLRGPSEKGRIPRRRWS